MNILHHLFFHSVSSEEVGGSKKSKSKLLYTALINPCLLFIVAIICELLSIAIMYCISSLLVSFSSNQMNTFLYSAMLGLGIVSCQALATAYRTYLRDSLALQLRVRMTSVLLQLQEDYALGNGNKRSISSFNESSSTTTTTSSTALLTTRITGIDQRMSQDIVDCTERLAQLYEKLIILPFIIAFYSYFLVKTLGPLSVTLCFLYFLLGFSVSKLFTPNIIKYTIYFAQFEGFARNILVSFVQNYATITLLHGGLVELKILQSFLQQVFLSRKTMIEKELQMRCSTMWFAYTGSVVSYVIVGVSLLISGGGNSKGGEETDGSNELRLQSWSRGSYACITLINAYTQCLDLLTLYSESRGYYLRIQSLVDVLEGGRANANASSIDENTWWKHVLYVGYLLGHVIFFPVICVVRKCRRRWKGSADRSRFGSDVGNDMIDMATLYSTHSVLNDDSDDELMLQDDIRDEQVDDVVIPMYTSSAQKQKKDSLKEWKQSKGLILKIEKHSLYSLPTTLGNRKLLIRHLNLSLHQGQRILVTGPTGCGKSTLLSYVAQLLRFYYEDVDIDDVNATAKEGTSPIKTMHNPMTPSKYHTVVCSQVPYILPQGTLRDNLCYPFLDAMRGNGNDSSINPKLQSSPVVFNTERAKWALEECALDHLVHLLFSTPSSGSTSTPETPMPSSANNGCCDCFQISTSDMDYSYRQQMSNVLVEECERLSTGQRQCLAMARLLYHANPQTIALLDEVSSGMDEETEHKIYTSLMIHVNTFISIGHRSSIRPFHTHELRIYKDCSFTFHEIAQSGSK